MGSLESGICIMSWKIKCANKRSNLTLNLFVFNISWSCPINQNRLMNVFSSYNNRRINKFSLYKKIAIKINYQFPISTLIVPLHPRSLPILPLKFSQSFHKFGQVESRPSLRTFKPRHWNVHRFQFLYMRPLPSHLLRHVKLIYIVVSERILDCFLVLSNSWWWR